MIIENSEINTGDAQRILLGLVREMDPEVASQNANTMDGELSRRQH
jgi:hypothetical protein